MRLNAAIIVNVQSDQKQSGDPLLQRLKFGLEIAATIQHMNLQAAAFKPGGECAGEEAGGVGQEHLRLFIVKSDSVIDKNRGNGQGGMYGTPCDIEAAPERVTDEKRE